MNKQLNNNKQKMSSKKKGEPSLFNFKTITISGGRLRKNHSQIFYYNRSATTKHETISSSKKLINISNNNDSSSRLYSPRTGSLKTPQKTNNKATTLLSSSTKKKLTEFYKNSLSIKLKGLITKETLTMELREELKYHKKFRENYKNYLTTVVNLREKIKSNKESVETMCENLKEEFKEKFLILESFDKKIKRLEETQERIKTSNEEIIRMRNDQQQKLEQEFDGIQDKIEQQRKTIAEIKKQICDLEKKKLHINEECIKQEKIDLKSFEKLEKEYKFLKKKYMFFQQEYNKYEKTGEELTKEEVRLFDKSNQNNIIIEENLEIKLNDANLKKERLTNVMEDLHKKIIDFEEAEKLKKKMEKFKYFNIGYKSNNHPRFSSVPKRRTLSIE